MVTNAGGEQVGGHDQRGGRQQPLGVADPLGQPRRRVRAVAADQWHHAHTGLEPGQAQHQQRECQHRRADHVADTALASGQRIGPARNQGRIPDHLRHADDDDDRVEQQEHPDQGNRDADSLTEPEQEHPAQDQQQHDGDHDRRCRPVQDPVGQDRVLQQVDRRVRRGQRDRDDPRGGHEPQQHQDEEFALPERQQTAPASPPTPGRADSPARPAGTSAASRTGSAPRSAASPAVTALPRPAPRCPAGTTGSRNSPLRSGTSPSTRTVAWCATHRPPGRRAAPGGATTTAPPDWTRARRPPAPRHIPAPPAGPLRADAHHAARRRSPPRAWPCASTGRLASDVLPRRWASGCRNGSRSSADTTQ